jgi:hypothetical protein
MSGALSNGHFPFDLDLDVEMSTLLYLCKEIFKTKEIQTFKESDLEPRHEIKPELLTSKLRAENLPPPSKYVRRRKSSFFPPQGPSPIYVEQEPTSTSTSAHKDEYDRRLEYLMDP